MWERALLAMFSGIASKLAPTWNRIEDGWETGLVL